jgi:REP element-mobilizing transposase RayT
VRPSGIALLAPLKILFASQLLIPSPPQVFSFFLVNAFVLSSNIKRIISKFSQKYGIKILSMANVGNHLHFQIKLSNRNTFKPFIRAVTSAIAMAVTGVSKWNKLKEKLKFWDRRPFTRVVKGFKAYLNLRDYIEINKLEGFGFQKPQARFFFAWNQLREEEANP